MPSKSKNPLDETLADADAHTLDRVLRLAPTDITEADLDAVIEAARRDRARLINKEGKGPAQAAKEDGGADVAAE